MYTKDQVSGSAAPPNASFNSAASWADACEVDNISFTHSPYGGYDLGGTNFSFGSTPERSPGGSSESLHDLDPTENRPLASQKGAVARQQPETTGNGTKSKGRGCNVYVSNLPTGVDDAWLRGEFSRYGLITSAKVMQAYSKKRVYAFVQFTEESTAQAAVEGANGMYVDNYPLVVKHADRDKDKGLPNQPSNNLYVSNIPTEFTLVQLESLFSPFGQVCSAVVLTYPQTGIGKGVGLVRYFCVPDATKAILDLHGKVLEGHDRLLEVKYAENQEARQVRKMPHKQREEHEAVYARQPNKGRSRQNNENKVCITSRALK